MVTTLWGILGCATTHNPSSVDPAHPDLNMLTVKEEATEALKLAHDNQMELQKLSAKVKEMETISSLLAEELSVVSPARFEELRNRVDFLILEFRRMEKSQSPAVVAPKDSTAALEKSKPQAKTGGMAPKDSIQKSSQKKPDSALITKETSSKAASPLPRENEAQLYKQAFDFYYRKEFTLAADKFGEIVEKYPTGEYADNSVYWIGECYFGLGNFVKATGFFHKVLTYSETEKDDDSQLKLGYCHLRLGDRKRAAEEFKKVVSLYPDSEYIERAKEELAKLE